MRRTRRRCGPTQSVVRFRPFARTREQYPYRCRSHRGMRAPLLDRETSFREEGRVLAQGGHALMKCVAAGRRVARHPGPIGRIRAGMSILTRVHRKLRLRFPGAQQEHGNKHRRKNADWCEKYQRSQTGRQDFNQWAGAGLRRSHRCDGGSVDGRSLMLAVAALAGDISGGLGNAPAGGPHMFMRIAVDLAGFRSGRGRSWPGRAGLAEVAAPNSSQSR